MQLLNRMAVFWPHLVALLTLFSAVLASGHAILHKRDSRAAVLWIGFIWLLPLVGPSLYLLLGINRVRRKAQLLRGAAAPVVASPPAADLPPYPEMGHLEPLATAIGGIVRHSPLRGNRVDPLVNGDAAFPAMLAAIEAATRTISLSTYIFDNDRCGAQFAAALGRAVARGVQVRVLIDAAGAHYSVPSIFHTLHHARVPVAKFLPTPSPWRMMSINLRNHRKILVVDGSVGFTGGINLREGNLLAQQPRHPVRDLHFRLEGPVVAQLQEAFVADWFFAKGESLAGPDWFPLLHPAGPVLARAIPDGPDEDFEKLHWSILAALSCARERVQILTPYFLPGIVVISALNLAALRGVSVDIILPARSNLPYVDWASRAIWWQVLENGCKIWLTSPPFDHSKLMLVDGQWALVGSGNWDARSLRLNFEFNLECYCRELAASLDAIVQSKLKGAHEVTCAEMDARPLPIKLRDGSARLLSPYL
jgi:cardiolipin synthase